MKKSQVMTLAALLMVTAVINQECSAQTPPPAAPAAPVAVAGAPASAPAGISGKVTFAGTPPVMGKLKREADPFCGKTVMNDEEVVVGAGGGLKNVAIRIVKGAAPAATPPAEPVTIAQDNCMYRARVSAGVVGQKLVIKNPDATMHNVHAYNGTATVFNQAQMKGGKDIEKTITLGATKFKCDVHPWMTGYVVGSDNPYVAVTGDDGSFTLAGVPAGTYTVEAWHEKYGAKTVDVTVVAGQPAAANFTFGQ